MLGSINMPGAAVMRVIDALTDIWNERVQQHEKWGEQHHPDGTGYAYAAEARHRRIICEDAHRLGIGTWRHILMEEVYEALAEKDPAKLRTELTHVAAVCVSWIGDIDSREGAGS